MTEKKELGEIIVGSLPSELSVLRDTEEHYGLLAQKTGKSADALARQDLRTACVNSAASLIPPSFIALIHLRGSVTLNGISLSERVWNIVSSPTGWGDLAERCYNRPELLIMNAPVLVAASAYIGAAYFAIQCAKNFTLVYKIDRYLKNKTTSESQ